MPFSPESIAARNAKRPPRLPAPPAQPIQIRKRQRRPGPAPIGRGRPTGRTDTRQAIFDAAAVAFSRDGFDSVGVEDIARAASVNKAMIYYHFKDKLALYREVVRDMLTVVGASVSEIAAGSGTPAAKIERFIEMLAEMRQDRPWFPPLMMREMAAGAPHLDNATLAHIRGVFLGFTSIVQEGIDVGVFRPVHPVMAYMSIMGPMMMNAVRERAAGAPGRQHIPIFAPLNRRDLIAHMKHSALSLLAKDRTR